MDEQAKRGAKLALVSDQSAEERARRMIKALASDEELALAFNRVADEAAPCDDETCGYCQLTAQLGEQAMELEHHAAVIKRLERRIRLLEVSHARR